MVVLTSGWIRCYDFVLNIWFSIFFRVCHDLKITVIAFLRIVHCGKHVLKETPMRWISWLYFLLTRFFKKVLKWNSTWIFSTKLIPYPDSTPTPLEYPVFIVFCVDSPMHSILDTFNTVIFTIHISVKTKQTSSKKW